MSSAILTRGDGRRVSLLTLAIVCLFCLPEVAFVADIK